MGRKTKIVLRLIAGVVLVALVLAGPSAVFYYNYFLPKTPLPAIQAENTRSWAAPGLDRELESELREAVAEAQRHVPVPSYSAAIGFSGQLQFAGTVGFSELESSTVAALDSQYRSASISKALTATLLVKLAAEGSIDLDQAIGKYVEDLPTDYSALTPRQLASHTAGVRHYSRIPSWWPSNNPAISGTNYESVRAGLAIFLDDPLLFAPGAGFEYSTFGYSLLSYALEGATGTDFITLMNDRLFVPLDLLNTTFDLPGSVPKRVSFYVSGDGKYVPAYPSGATYKLAGGGILSTASDLASFGLALLDDSFLPENSRDILFTPVLLDDGSTNPQNYGLGFRIDESVRLLGEDRPTTIHHHGGLQNGAVSFFMVIPAYGISVAALANTRDGAARSEVQELCYELARSVILSREW